MSTWTKEKLGDVALIESGGTPSSANSTFWDGGNINWATLPDLHNKYLFNTQRKITRLGVEHSSAKVLPINTVIFSSRATIGEVTIAKVETSTNQGSKNFICEPDKILYEFLYYWLKLNARRIERMASGTTYKEINKTELSNLKIDLPDLPTQTCIADVLSAYDNLIENNEKRIKILEEMAQLLYTEWFAKFKFPGHEKVKLVDSGTTFGKIPELWEVKNVEALIKRISAGKKYENKTVFRSGKVPVLDQGKTGLIGYHNDEPGVRVSIDKPVIVFANHTCYQNIIIFPFSAIQNVLPFIPNDERDIFWLHWATKDLIEFNDYKGHWPEFMSKRFIVPPVELTKKFGDVVGGYVVMKYKLESENKKLSEIRDLLISQLVTGKRELK